MVTSCCAYGCTYRYKKGGEIGIFRFPRNEIRRRAWINAIKRKNWEPNAGSRICGKHFQTGKPNKDDNHPDFVPNVFAFSKVKNSAKIYEMRKKKLEAKKLRQKENEAVSALLDLQSPTFDPVTPIQIDVQSNNEENDVGNTIEALSLEINFLRAEKWQLQKEVQMLHPTQSILGDEKKLLLHTGVASIKLFQWILKVSKTEVDDNMTIDLETQLLIVLMKLKLNLLFMYLAGRFNISRTMIQRICDKWIPVLGSILSSLIQWPDKKKLKKNLPKCFLTSIYKNTTCIIDCTEVEMQRPSNQKAQAQTWSHYKSAHTLKFLVSITPTGYICFVSEPWGGRASDKEITLRSGFLNFICPGDVVLADRGFMVNDDFKNKGAKLIVPSFTKGKKQLSQEEVYYSRKVSNVRIHVERAIKQIKRFKVLQTKVPIIFLKYMKDVIVICAALSNLTEPIVKDSE